MSRIGKKPIQLPDGVTLQVNGTLLSFKGPKGSVSLIIHPDMMIKVENNKEILVERPSESQNHRALHGLTRTLVDNAVTGVKSGFVRSLEVQGVGYKVNVQGKKLILNVGFSHPVEFDPPEGITLAIDKDNKNMVLIQGVDKQLVGQVAANIRAIKKPEPYKGKGIIYTGERIRRKAGKTASK